MPTTSSTLTSSRRNGLAVVTPTWTPGWFARAERALRRRVEALADASLAAAARRRQMPRRIDDATLRDLGVSHVDMLGLGFDPIDRRERRRVPRQG